MKDISTSISGVARAFDHLLGWSFADCNCPNCEQARKELSTFLQEAESAERVNRTLDSPGEEEFIIDQCEGEHDS